MRVSRFDSEEGSRRLIPLRSANVANAEENLQHD